MSSIYLIFLCLVIGILLQRVRTLPFASYKTLNQFVIYISLPALSLYFIPELTFDRTLLLPVGVAWICFGGACLLFWTLGKAFGWSKKLIGCLILTAGLGNTSFIGFPVIEALYGKEALKTALLVDQPGTFVVLSTVGIALAAYFSRGATTARDIARKIFSFPPFLTFLAAIFMNILGLHFSDEFKEVFQRIGSTVTPIALVSVGLQLKIERKSKHWRFLIMGLTYQLVIAPALIFCLYVYVFKARGEVVQVSIMEAAMAPMITAAIVAAAHGLKPRLANMMIGFGVPISFITLCFWYWLVQGL
jgi:predicted permease